jgi:nicotinate phosphoribosyltransferase
VNHQPRPDPGAVPLGTALLTDHYELTMLQASLRSGAADRRAVFEVFARHLPHGRRYGVVAGTGRLLDAIERFRFGPADLDFLGDAGIVDEPTLAFLESYRFSGNIWGYSEGDCYFPGSPILVVEGTFAEAVLLETVSLSILNHDCAIASAASRMVTAAGDRPLIEMGSRRTHERAAVASARAAYIAGFASTSNLRARYEFGIPSAGTSAHAFTLIHDSERHAFATQLESLGKGTTLRSGPRSRWRAASWARCGSTAATCRCWPGRSGSCSIRWGLRVRGSSSPVTWTNTPSRRSARSRWMATGWARRW